MIAFFYINTFIQIMSAVFLKSINGTFEEEKKKLVINFGCLKDKDLNFINEYFSTIEHLEIIQSASHLDCKILLNLPSLKTFKIFEDDGLPMEFYNSLLQMPLLENLLIFGYNEHTSSLCILAKLEKLKILNIGDFKNTAALLSIIKACPPSLISLQLQCGRNPIDISDFVDFIVVGNHLSNTTSLYFTNCHLRGQLDLLKNIFSLRWIIIIYHSAAASFSAVSKKIRIRPMTEKFNEISEMILEKELKDRGGYLKIESR